MNSLAGKVALVTGASRGIGLATARELSAQGATVVLAARSGDLIERYAADLRSAGRKASAKVCDVAVFEQVDAMVEQTCEGFGGLDILVNNAGVIDPIARLSESDPQVWGTGGCRRRHYHQYQLGCRKQRARRLEPLLL